MKRVCVFTGSRPGERPVFRDAAVDCADALVDRGLGLVYGGASVGLMGVIADRVLERGGEAIGVIPKHLESKEVAHKNLTALHVVGNMAERKAMMDELSDASIALPGGFGTLDELFEIATAVQLGLHAKPLGVVNVDGYYNDLLAFLDRATADGFLRPQLRAIVVSETTAAALLDAFAAAAQP